MLWAILLLPLGQAPLLDRLQSTGRPVEMTASGGLSLDLKRHVGLARGDVLIQRDDVSVCCDEAEAQYVGDRIERVTCRGRVVIVRSDGTRATAAMAVFVASDDQVTLSGGARVVSEQADLSGEKIIYDIGKDRLAVEGGRSRFKFKPALTEPLPRACPPEGAKKAPRAKP